MILKMEMNVDTKKSDAISIDGSVFQVLVNDEGQHSINPAAQSEGPAGAPQSGR
jgi:uncharacterized protein YbdZ (MbtH family)